MGPPYPSAERQGSSSDLAALQLLVGFVPGCIDYLTVDMYVRVHIYTHMCMYVFRYVYVCVIYM